MAYYDRGYRPRGGYRGGEWSSPNVDVTGTSYGRGSAGERPWVGGYRDGYQGGSGGYRTGGFRQGGYDYGYRGDRGGQGGGRRQGQRDEWWLGGHHPGRYDTDYDRQYQEFDRSSRPQYSPVGGNYHAMGGSYMYGRPPRPLREDMWFSDWTRWF